MKVRIIVGAALSILLVVLLISGGYPLLVALALFSFAAVYEVGLALRNKGLKPWLFANYVFVLAAPFVFFFWGLNALIVLYAGAVAVTMICSLFSSKIGAQDMMAALFIHEYPTLLLVCLALVYFSFDRALGLTAACLAFAAPQFADTIAFFVGTFLGKRKLCPSISPKKTVEGSIGALVGGLAFGAILIPLQGLWDGYVSVIALLLIGLCCGILSQVGDLFASFIKRWAEVKDFSSLFPGHGGVMDRLDSILFCAPFVLLCFTILTKIGIY